MVDEKGGIMQRFRMINFVKTYATNAFVYRTDQDVRIELANEKLKANPNDSDWTMVIESMVILSPEGAKKLFSNLKQVLEEEKK